MSQRGAGLPSTTQFRGKKPDAQSTSKFKVTGVPHTTSAHRNRRDFVSLSHVAGLCRYYSHNVEAQAQCTHALAMLRGREGIFGGVLAKRFALGDPTNFFEV